MINIDDLPVYVWPNIFRNLSIDDLFNCRLVNKKFKDFSNFSDGISRLIIGEYNFNFNNLNYFGKTIEEDILISFKCFQRIKSLSLFDLERNLKYLRIYRLNYSCKFEKVSSLNNLEFLIIEPGAIHNNLSINLENLKFLKLTENINYYNLDLNTPKLENLKLRSLKNIYFTSNPESIKYINLNHYENDLRKFKNLEIIEIWYLRFDFDVDLLSSFNKLNSIKIRFSYIYGEVSREDLINFFTKFKNKNLNIYIEGIKMLDFEMIINSRIFFNNLNYQIENYNLLDFDLEATSINYSSLENLFTDIQNDLPPDFFNKYSNLLNINVSNNIKNFDNLNWFLNNLKQRSISVYLVNLSTIDQNFFNNLPSKIRNLEITRKNHNKNSTIDYNFLFKLTKLNWFETNENIDLFQLVLNLFLNSKYLKHFAFKFYGKKIRIERINENYRLLIGSYSKGRNLDHKNLTELCNKAKNLI